MVKLIALCAKLSGLAPATNAYRKALAIRGHRGATTFTGLLDHIGRVRLVVHLLRDIGGGLADNLWAEWGRKIDGVVRCSCVEKGGRN